jgi:hypothetical protein
MYSSTRCIRAEYSARLAFLVKATHLYRGVAANASKIPELRRNSGTVSVAGIVYGRGWLGRQDT